MAIDRFISSPGAICTNPLSPAEFASMAGKYIGWAESVTEQNAEWHRNEQKEFYTWLDNNGFDSTDKKLALGFIKIGQCDLMKSFGTENRQKIWQILSTHLDIHKIEIDGVSNTFDYVWSQPDFKDLQISVMKPGYDHSSKQPIHEY